MDKKMIGLRIKELRKSMHITGAQIKEQTGISTGNLSDIEHGKCMPSSTAVIQLSQILNCSTDYILLGKTRESENDVRSNIRDTKILDLYSALPSDDKDEIMMLLELKYSKLQKLKTEEKSSLFIEKDEAHEIA